MKTANHVVCDSRGEKKHTQEEKGGGVWPTFHLALSTVSQGMHAEWLDSLCNTHIQPPHHLPFITPTCPTPCRPHDFSK